MKKFAFPFLIMVFLAGVILFPGCEKIKSLADVKFNTNLVADLNVIIPALNKKSATLKTYSFHESATVDPREDPDIDEYFDNLKGYKVEKVTGTIKSVSGGPITILTGTLTIVSGDISATWQINDFEVKSGATVTLGNEEGQWDDLQQVLNEKKKFTVTIDGTADKAGVSFLLSVDMAVEVTANPLK